MTWGQARLNTTHPTGWNMGLEGRLEANGQRHLVEGRFFMDTGRDLSFRPFWASAV
jgi:hypothetical protein